MIMWFKRLVCFWQGHAHEGYILHNTNIFIEGFAIFSACRSESQALFSGVVVFAPVHVGGRKRSAKPRGPPANRV